MLLTVIYIILNTSIASLSTIALHLNWSNQRTAFHETAFFVLGSFIIYSSGSLLVWYIFPLRDYYTLAFPFPLLLGPILYFLSDGYINKRPRKKDWIHVLPFLGSLSFYISFVLYADFRNEYGTMYYSLLYTLTLISLIGYGVKSTLIWSKSLQKPASFLFVREGRIISLFLLLWVALFLIPTVLVTNAYIDTQGVVHIVLYLLILFIGWRVYLSIYRQINPSPTRQSSPILLPILNHSINHSNEVQEDGDSPITEAQKREYAQRIQLFIQTKGFVDPDINRDKFIEITNIPSAHLYYFLPHYYDKSFSAFINKLRVDYAAQELSKSDFSATVDDLGAACGFQSRASFYRNFTTEFGCSPLEYRANHIHPHHAKVSF